MALAVGEKIDYAVINKNGERYILAKDLVEKILDQPYKIEKMIKGKDLVGLEYESLFNIPALKSDKSYKIYPADFVTTEEGTGVVHTAVMYGEDDYQLGEKIGLPKYHTVDKEGKFAEDVPEFAGKSVKDADKEIISYLQEKNLLFKVEPYSHEYPHCWRCKTALLYYATDSWFVKTTAVKNKLIANNKKINWIPSYIKEGRFGQWLNEVKDWAFSRSRYWGTPLPVWQCQKCENKFVAGSLEELEKKRFRKPNKYFLMRHAESKKNNLAGKEIINSKLKHDKYDLTEKGVKQAEEAAKKLKKEKIDFIFSSPFLRAKKTAEIVSKEFSLDFKIDERLKEIDHGSVCEGKDHYVCVTEEEYPRFDVKFGLDGESRNDVKKRMFDLVKEMDDKYEGKNILLVSHGDPLWLLEGIANSLNESDLIKVKKGQSFMQRNNHEPWLPKTAEFRDVEFKNHPRDEFGNLDLHRPYIDEIFLKCQTRLPAGQECKSQMQRVPEVIDVWFDSGAMPFAQLHYPFENKNEFKENFPADFITEGVDQTRGWFYTLLAVSTLLGFGPPYKNVISLGFVLDKNGKKMSKSIGNVVSPDYVIEKFGADVVRWWFYRVNQAGESKNFREEELKEINNGFVRVITNSLRFWQLYSQKANSQQPTAKNFHTIKSKDLDLLDRWLLSKWNNLTGLVTKSLDEYDATTASREIEKFMIEDLSNWWIRRSRDKFQSGKGYQQDLLRFILLELAKLIAPFTPFLAEHLHEQLHHGTTPVTISVHFHDWPKENKKLIDKNLEEEMDLVRKIVSLGLALRKEKNIKVRQPLAKLNLKLKIENLKLNEELTDLIKEEVNVKEVKFEKGEELSVVLDTEITLALRNEGWVREFIRIIQDVRKDAGYEYDQKVQAFWFTEDRSLKEAILRESGFIKQKTVLKDLRESRHDPKFAYDVEKEQEIEPGRKIWLGLKK